ncbi:caspase domain-containing protein [Flagelloscypha sp. PMI_526]|nr:caspase domain-containing protein [Flagelloscypha sp. PMI_526]
MGRHSEDEYEEVSEEEVASEPAASDEEEVASEPASDGEPEDSEEEKPSKKDKKDKGKKDKGKKEKGKKDKGEKEKKDKGKKDKGEKDKGKKDKGKKDESKKNKKDKKHHERPPAEEQDYDVEYEDEEGNAEHPHYRYSQCTGKKKGLFIGINYFGTQSELRGCINDVQNISKFLVDNYDFEYGDNIRLLTDDQQDPDLLPTTVNIIKGMLWLVEDAQPDDSLFFFYSGHGASVEDQDGDEVDGKDEAILPCDFNTPEGGFIRDDDLHAIMVAPLPEGCRLTALMDCCHSGTCMDLPYTYTIDGAIHEPDLSAEAADGLFQAQKSGNQADMLRYAKEVAQQLERKERHAVAKATRTSAADVIAFSGCLDEQTSADTQHDGKATGAVSWAFRTTLTEEPEQSYAELIQNLHRLLEERYTQKPMLTTSHPMDTDYLFFL